MRKGICSDVSGVITKKLINKESYKEDHPPSSNDEDIKKYRQEILHEDEKQETSNQLPQYQRIAKDHLLDQIQINIKRGVSTMSHVNKFYKYFAFIYQIEP